VEVSEVTRVGFIGLGNQGAPMARRIADAGFALTLWARRPASVEPFRDTPAEVVATPAELGARSDIVGICVFSDDDVDDVVLRADGVLAGMLPGGVVVIHSTVHPRTCYRVAERAGERGIKVVDAPVSGSATAALEQRLVVMMGGDEADVARCMPIFESFGNPIIHVGPLGSGQIAKVINNLVLAAHMSLAIDTFDFAGALGLDQAAMASVLAHGSGASTAAALLAGAGFDGEWLRRGATPYFVKDLAIVQDIAAGAVLEPPASMMTLAERAVLTS
jgi:3-hydroxyisobutyrate dehydrogenase